jgi:hypothetical protein
VSLLVFFIRIQWRNPSDLIEIKNNASGRTIKTIPVDFGLIQDGQIREKRFMIHNDLTSSIHLKPVSSTCGCVSIQTATTIPPNTTDFILLLFNPIGQKGKERQKVGVDIDHGNISHLTFEIAAEVDPVVSYSPHLLVFLKNPVQDLSKKIHISSRRSHFQIRMIEIPTGYVLSHVVGDSVSNGSTITVTQKPRSDALDLHKLRIEGDQGEYILCDILEQEQRYFDVQPPTVHFVLADETTPYRMTLSIRPNFDITDSSELLCQSPFPALLIKKTKNLELGDQGQIISPYELSITLSAHDIRNSTRGYLQLKQGTLEQQIPIWITKIET